MQLLQMEHPKFQSEFVQATRLILQIGVTVSEQIGKRFGKFT